MRRCLFSILIWTLSASAQPPAGLPACAKPAFDAGIQGSGCTAGDKTCLCASDKLKSAVEIASEACNEADLEALSSALNNLCDDAATQTPRDSGNEDDEPLPQPAEEPLSPASAPTAASEEGDGVEEQPAEAAPAPAVASEDSHQTAVETPTALEDVPAVETEDTDQATLDSPPTAIAAPQTPISTAATALETDTHEFSFHHHPSKVDGAATTQEQTSTTSPSPVETTLVSSTQTASATGDAGGEVAMSVGALVVAVAGLTWVFAEF